MTISSVSNFSKPNCLKRNFAQGQKHSFNYVKYTGYASIASGVGCAALYKKSKWHKSLAFLTAVFTILHVGIIESYKFKNKSKTKGTN